LFDVTELLQSEYDDAHRRTVPLIIRYRDGVRSTPKLSAGAVAGPVLTSIGSQAVAVPKDKAATFWAGLGAAKGADRQLGNGIEKIWLDGVRRPSLDVSVPQIGAPLAWQAGFTGKGTTVLDTGIDATPPDLVGKVAEAKDFVGSGPGDYVGHGTRVASTIAGSGAGSASRYKGVAPDADLFDGKVCQFGCPESAILAGMEWAAVEKADIVNLSLGGPNGPELDPLEEAIDRLTAQTGTLFVVAAGNSPCSGPRYGVTSPATGDAALAVGAVGRSDQLAEFSCTGPRSGDSAIKPDITASGVDILAARATGTGQEAPENPRYTRMSGTSMATPHVVGSAAILAQQHPSWTARQLMGSARPTAGLSVFEQGSGRVDIGQAVKQTVITDQPSLSFATQVWPHTDDAPVSRPLVYRNVGTADVELALSVAAIGPDAKPAPEGAVRLSKTSLRVPAGGTAQVTVTSNTRHSGPDGLYTGSIVAKSPAGSVLTTLGVDKELESFNLTIEHLDRQGKPTWPVETAVAAIDETLYEVAYRPTSVVRLPKGRYTLYSYLNMVVGDVEDKVFLSQPELVLDKDATVTVNGAAGKPVKVTVPDKTATPSNIVVSFARKNVLESRAEPLCALLGTTRAAVLKAIAESCVTTTELARRCKISVSTVSRQTGVLRDARLITSWGAGRTVLHELTVLGRSLLESSQHPIQEAQDLG
jgi:subtilisin family serine protease/DNA-binding MarR family transcriptional regulator